MLLQSKCLTERGAETEGSNELGKSPTCSHEDDRDEDLITEFEEFFVLITGLSDLFNTVAVTVLHAPVNDDYF